MNEFNIKKFCEKYVSIKDAAKELDLSYSEIYNHETLRSIKVSPSLTNANNHIWICRESLKRKFPKYELLSKTWENHNKFKYPNINGKNIPQDFLTTKQVSKRLGVSIELGITYIMRVGLLKGKKDNIGRWWICPQSVERLKSFITGKHNQNTDYYTIEQSAKFLGVSKSTLVSMLLGPRKILLPKKKINNQIYLHKENIKRYLSLLSKVPEIDINGCKRHKNIISALVMLAHQGKDPSQYISATEAAKYLELPITTIRALFNHWKEKGVENNAFATMFFQQDRIERYKAFLEQEVLCQ